MERGAARARVGGPDVAALTVLRGLGKDIGAADVCRVEAGHGRAAGARPALPALIAVAPLRQDAVAAVAADTARVVCRPSAEVRRCWSSCARGQLVIA